MGPNNILPKFYTFSIIKTDDQVLNDFKNKSLLCHIY